LAKYLGEGTSHKEPEETPALLLLPLMSSRIPLSTKIMTTSRRRMTKNVIPAVHPDASPAMSPLLLGVAGASSD
jgi:hypothetical protein